MRKVLGVTLLLVFLGVVFTVVGFLMSDETDFNLIERPDYTLTELTYEADEVSEFMMLFNNRAIEILPSETDQITIRYYEAENDWIEVSLEDKNLELVNRTRWFLGISWGVWNWGGIDYNNVEIYLPASVMDYVLDITTSNGAITMMDITNLKEVNFASSNGAIKIEDVHVTDYFKVDTSNGKITLDYVTSDVLVSVHTSNGEIDIDHLTALDINAHTSNGAIEVNIYGEYSLYRIELDTSNGSTYVDGDEKNDSIYNPSLDNVINLDTSNGSIRLNFIN